MNFGQALEALKSGKRVARAGWNGKGMFVYLVAGSIPSDLKHPAFQERPVEPGDELFGIDDAVVLTRDGVSHIHFEMGDAGTAVRMPHLNMRTASGAIVTGWLASQTDMLAEDWSVVE